MVTTAGATGGRLSEFRRAMVQAGYAPATFNRNWSHLRAVLCRLGPPADRNPQGESIIGRGPYVKMLSVERDFPRLARFEELDALYEAMAVAAKPGGGEIPPPPDLWR